MTADPPRSAVVLVVEDDPAIREGLVDALGFQGHRVLQADTAPAAAEAALRSRCDLVLLDLMLPGGDGLQVLREVRRVKPRLPVIIITARGREADRVRGLQLGADDYVVKPFEIDELLARIQALLRRTHGFGRLQVGPLEFDRLRRAVTLSGQALDLTPREYALLLLLAHQDGRPVGRSEMLAQVWSTSFDPGSNLVDVQISRLRDKLGDHAWMIDTVRGRGYRLRKEPP